MSIPTRVRAPVESRALTEAFDRVAPTSPTACEGWTAHDIAAHVAAGAKEVAELIDARLAGRPSRPTRSFAEREAPFAALDDDALRGAMLEESRRKMAALGALFELGDYGAIQFRAPARPRREPRGGREGGLGALALRRALAPIPLALLAAATPSAELLP